MFGEQTQFNEMFQSFGPYSKDALPEGSNFFMHPNKLIKPGPN